jgi:hypothetical protein
VAIVAVSNPKVRSVLARSLSIVLGTAVSKVFNLEIARTGLRERDAHRAGFAYVTVTYARAPDFPGTQRMTVKMTALDLAYAPPFSPVWDPILVAARQASATVRAAP